MVHIIINTKIMLYDIRSAFHNCNRCNNRQRGRRGWPAAIAVDSRQRSTTADGQRSTADETAVWTRSHVGIFVLCVFAVPVSFPPTLLPVLPALPATYSTSTLNPNYYNRVPFFAKLMICNPSPTQPNLNPTQIAIRYTYVYTSIDYAGYPGLDRNGPGL